jgi:hypothetical protein
MALTTNIVAYWKLDESSGNATDSVGSNTLTNTNVTYTAGKINNGAVFNSTTDKFAPASVPVTGNSAFTVSAWVYPTNTGSEQGFVFYWGNISSKASTYLKYNLSGGAKIGFGAFGADLTYSVTLTTSTWYHLVYTYDQSNAILYINGSAVSTQGLSGLNVGTNTARVGISIDDDSSSVWKGSLDEIGIWSRALSSTEVTSLYNSGNGIQYPFAVGPANLKSRNGLAKASIKSINGLAIGSIKSINGLA